MNAAVEAHKARVSAASAAAEQHRENITLKPVPKGKKEEPLELHPEAFVRIKAQKITEEPSATVTVDMSSLVEIKAAPALDVEVCSILQWQYNLCSSLLGIQLLPSTCWPQCKYIGSALLGICAVTTSLGSQPFMHILPSVKLCLREQ